MTLDLETLIAPAISVIVSVVVAWMAWSSRLAVLETKLDDLSEDVRKHNNLVERMARLEISDKAQWERLDERREECHELQKEVAELNHKMASYHHV